jgi:Cu/Ag efflux protein CusF
MKIRRFGSARLAETALCLALLFLPACARQPTKKEYAFRGVVERVDSATHTLSVLGGDVPGWMGPMTMTYQADKADVVERVKVGDQITARVIEGDFKTLYDVQVVAKSTSAPAPAP